MKKVVVVVDEHTKEFIEGKNLSMIEPDLKHLIVQDEDEQLATFVCWIYWRKME